jgi:hypothetical protein
MKLAIYAWLVWALLTDGMLSAHKIGNVGTLRNQERKAGEDIR